MVLVINLTPLLQPCGFILLPHHLKILFILFLFMKNNTGVSWLTKTKLSLDNTKEEDEVTRMVLREGWRFQVMDLHGPYETNSIKEIALIIIAAKHKMISNIK